MKLKFMLHGLEPAFILQQLHDRIKMTWVKFRGKKTSSSYCEEKLAAIYPGTQPNPKKDWYIYKLLKL